MPDLAVQSVEASAQAPTQRGAVPAAAPGVAQQRRAAAAAAPAAAEGGLDAARCLRQAVYGAAVVARDELLLDLAETLGR